MADQIENPEGDSAEDPGGSLADAIAAHMALKKEHGADPEEVEHELEDALSPPIREQAPAAEPAAEPEPGPDPEPAPEPVAAKAPPAPEPKPEPVPAPAPEAAVAPSVEAPKPGEITGTIEFEFGDEEKAPEPQIDEASSEGDLLEATPDFFEETPEHDKLWFDEAPPRKFDF